MSLIRTFAAVVPPPTVRSAVADFLTPHHHALAGVRCVPPENMHLTLRFFGDLTPDQVAVAGEAMDEVAALAVPFPLELRGLGVFPGWDKPRVLWMGIGDGAQRLGALARVLDDAFDAAGLGRADRPFRAHLTLARWRHPGRPPAPPNLAQALFTRRFPVNEAVLFSSRTEPGGPVYRIMHTARLGGETR